MRFRTAARWVQMVALGLDENLDAIAGGEDLSRIVLSLIKWAESSGRIPELVLKAREENPGNPELLAFAAAFETRDVAPPMGDAETRATSVREPSRANPSATIVGYAALLNGLVIASYGIVVTIRTDDGSGDAGCYFPLIGMATCKLGGGYVVVAGIFALLGAVALFHRSRTAIPFTWLTGLMLLPMTTLAVLGGSYHGQTALLVAVGAFSVGIAIAAMLQKRNLS